MRLLGLTGSKWTIGVNNQHKLQSLRPAIPKRYSQNHRYIQLPKIRFWSYLWWMIRRWILTLLLVTTANVVSAVAGEEDPTHASSNPPERESHEHRVGCDIIEAGRQAGGGFIQQFTNMDSLVLIGSTASVTLLLTLREEEMQLAVEDAAILGSVGQKIGDVAGIVLNFGVIPIAAYSLGRALDNDKAVHFAIELAATHSIALVETFIISQIPFHERPVYERGEMEPEEGNFFNDALRGKSSYPSGHMVGVSALMFESWKWYGWKLGIPSTLATLFLGWARVEEGQHYITDIFGTIALTGIASLAVTRSRNLLTKLVADRSRTVRVMAWPVVGENQGQLFLLGQF